VRAKCIIIVIEDFVVIKLTPPLTSLKGGAVDVYMLIGIFLGPRKLRVAEIH
jgi:hypothetical protein